MKSFTPFFASAVDIIVPFHGQYLHVQRCLDSIYRHTNTNPFRVILVDDASPCKDFIHEVQKQCPAVGVRLEERAGFAGALLAGYMESTCPWVVFMHSDVEVATMDWLLQLGETLVRGKAQNVRMALASSNNPGIENKFIRARHGPGEYNDVVSTDEPLPLYCAMFHRELFPRIGGFLQTYPYAGYEDTELFYRMKARGYLQAVCGRSWVKHAGGATISAVSDADPAARAEMEKNKDRCIEDLKRLLPPKKG